MKSSFVFLAFLACVFCINSGIKAGLDTEIFKIVSQIDFNKVLANKILLNHTEVSGSMIMKYNLVIDNLTMIDIQSPKVFQIDHVNKDDGTPLIKINAQNLEGTIALDFSLKYGVFKDEGKQTKVKATVNSVKGEFYFTPTGDVVISTFEVDIGKIDIDFKSGFIKFIYALARGLIVKTIEKQIKTLTTIISTAINKWVNDQFLFDLGFGIGFNLTNIDRPTLFPFSKNIERGFLASLLDLLIVNKFEKNLLNTTILTAGIHGSVYPNFSPEIRADIPEAVDMEFNPILFNNEINLLLSDFSLNTLLFMAQQTGYLHKEFTQQDNPIFPFDFTVQGLSKVIPEFKNKYPDPKENFPVQMKVFIAPQNWAQPQLHSAAEKTDLLLNFGLDFDTTWSDDPFDDPSKDLQLNVTMSSKIYFFVVNNVLIIKITNAKVTNIVKKTDELSVPEENLTKLIEDNFQNLIFPMLNKYVSELKVVELLNKATGLSFKNFHLESYDGYHGVSLGINGLNSN